MISNDYNFENNDVFYDPSICKKISLAIKRSKVLDHIKPINLLKEKLALQLAQENYYDSMPPNKMARIQNPRQLGSPLKSFLPNPITNKGGATNLPTPESQVLSTKPLTESVKKVVTESCEPSKSPPNSSSGILPTPASLFDDVPLESNQSSGKVIRSNEQQNLTNNLQEDIVKEKNVMFGMHKNISTDKNMQHDKLKEKPRNLFNLATSLLPLPSQLFDKHSMINALDTCNLSGFLDLFKEGIKIEHQISSDDLVQIINAMVKGNALTVLPEVCNCLEYMTSYCQVLSDSFIKYKNEMKGYHEYVLDCIQSMIDLNNSASLIAFIEACYAVSDWNRMWAVVMSKNPTYIFDDKYFHACMAVFQNWSNKAEFMSHDTMLIILNYVTRNHPTISNVYTADIWLYCVLTTDINSETDLKVPPQILEKVIEKLVVMKNPPFLFIMKLLYKNWSLLNHKIFGPWLSQLISDKSDVKQCLFTLKESMETLMPSDIEISNLFLLLVLQVMSSLNKKSLFTCSKSIYDTFLQRKFDQLRSLLSFRADRFKYKWIMVDCLISSAEYESALDILKGFEVLKDLESSFDEYNKVKEVLPNLVWHLLNIKNLLPIIDLFEQVVSIFIFNENIDSSYTKNCNEIFDLMVEKAFESNNKDVVKKMILLLDHILSADIEFNISKECLRYLLVASVRTDVPFNELLDFIELCFKFEVFESIQTAEDGFGSVVNVNSNLAPEEVTVLITWLCRLVKIKLVDLAQSEGASVRENLMKVCSLKFFLRPSKSSDMLAKKLGSSSSDLLANFTAALGGPKYLSHPIKFTVNDSAPHDCLKIICDNRVVYNAIYYSDI